jgi:hypothetical protein
MAHRAMGAVATDDKAVAGAFGAAIGMLELDRDLVALLAQSGQRDAAVDRSPEPAEMLA